MQNETLLRQIRDTGELLGLDEAIIEKDYYVTQVIHALSNVKNEYFRLIFCGGTCLAKAHKLVGRMSEDIDFKIELKSKCDFSRSELKKQLKAFRSQIRPIFIMPDLLVSDNVVRNEGRYQKITLKYPYSFPVASTLRPDIKVEFTYANILLPTDELKVKTIIEDTIKEVNLFTSPSTHCLSIDETAIEKWVGLTRRIIAIERKYEDDDMTLIRHVYDLNAINMANLPNSNFVKLARTVVANDGKQFKSQHPEYANDPISEIKQSLIILKRKPKWKERYEAFIEAMVYDNASAQSYGQAIKALEGISEDVIDTLC